MEANSGDFLLGSAADSSWQRTAVEPGMHHPVTGFSPHNRKAGVLWERVYAEGGDRIVASEAVEDALLVLKTGDFSLF